MAHFVLEVGVEEMPARFLPGLDRELAERFTSGLQEAGLEFSLVSAASTPRRLVITVAHVGAVQKTEEIVVSGPPLGVAFDAQGQPTKAGLGFAKSQGVAFEHTFVQKTEKGNYLALRKVTGGSTAETILAEICPRVLSALPFPKKMQWMNKNCTFGRPIRWILALLDERVVAFSFAGLDSANQTRGHRVMGPGPFVVAHADQYQRILREQGQVVLQMQERKNYIQSEGDRLAATVGGQVEWSEALLDQVANLVESPRMILGAFQKDFLDLPAAVLLTSMETHQKSFGLCAPDGTLLPYFLTAANIESREPELVRKGWERVLRARLEDARFFWKADRAASFTDWLEKLDRVVFIGPLGTMGDKSRRLEKLAADIATRVAPELATDLARAGRLSKADLVSEMVFEFDDLQGIMGGIYARLHGESETVVTALSEHYLPAGPDSPLPSSLPGAVLSLADKLDNLAGCFGLGMMPTGTADPYALRRNALGICRILLDYNLHLDLPSLLATAQAGFTDVTWKLDPARALDVLLEFFAQRLRALWGSQGVETVVLDAALAVGFDDLLDTWQRIRALDVFSRQDGFEAAVLTFKRAANIIRKQADQELSGQVRPELFEQEAETSLWQTLLELEPQWEELAKGADYGLMLGKLGDLRPVVDAFFDSVMVMCEDEGLRTNRLNLLFRLVSALGRVADFGRLQV